MGTIQHIAMGVQGALFDSKPMARAVEAALSPTDPAAALVAREGEQAPIWYEPHDVHITQVRTERLPDAPLGTNQNCGPVSVVTALRLAGLDVPGFAGERAQRVVDAARMLSTGHVDHQDSTNLGELTAALEAAGAGVTQLRSTDEMLDTVRGGGVVMLRGNSAADGWWRDVFQRPAATPRGESGHIVTIGRHYPDTDRFGVNDPGASSAIYVTADQLRAFDDGGIARIRDHRMAVSVTGPALDLRPRAATGRGD